MTTDGRDDGAADRDPFGESSIEVSDADLRRASPGAWFAGLTERINEVATRLTYGRK